MLDTTDNSIADIQSDINKAIAAIETIILGKSTQIKLAVCCLIARGHCLIEDLPGVGKTTLSQSIAQVFGLAFNRIQFTSDLLPADILGVSIFDPELQAFKFHPGPIFAHFLLADEINRATPKTQSALLEAMEEKQITVEGCNPSPGRALFRDRHAEPARSVRNLSAARIATGSFHDEVVAGLSRRGSRARAALGR